MYIAKNRQVPLNMLKMKNSTPHLTIFWKISGRFFCQELLKHKLLIQAWFGGVKF